MNTRDLINEIKEVTKANCSSSKKDEVRVMQSMLNDKEYSVKTYNADGTTEDYCPSSDARSALAIALASAAKISKDEATALANEHTFGKEEAAAQVRISKEFVNTYVLEAGRKLPLGGRETSNITLSRKVVAETVNRRPVKETAPDGTVIHKSVPMDHATPEHLSLKVSASCPTWLK